MYIRLADGLARAGWFFLVLEVKIKEMMRKKKVFVEIETVNSRIRRDGDLWSEIVNS